MGCSSSSTAHRDQLQPSSTGRSPAPGSVVQSTAPEDVKLEVVGVDVPAEETFEMHIDELPPTCSGVFRRRPLRGHTLLWVGSRVDSMLCFHHYYLFSYSSA